MAGLHGTKIANVSSSSASWRPPDKDLLPESDRGPPAQIPPWARSGARQCRRPVKAFERAGVKARTASPSKPIAAPLLFDNGPPRCCTRGHIQKPGGPATWSRHQKEMPRMRSNTARTASKNSKTHSTRHPLSKAPGRSSRAQLKEATAPAAESAVRAAEHTGPCQPGRGINERPRRLVSVSSHLPVRGPRRRAPRAPRRLVPHLVAAARGVTGWPGTGEGIG